MEESWHLKTEISSKLQRVSIRERVGVIGCLSWSLSWSAIPC